MLWSWNTLPLSMGGEVLKYIVAQFLTKSNPAKLPYIGAMMAQGEASCMLKIQYERTFRGSLHRRPEPQNQS